MTPSNTGDRIPDSSCDIKSETNPGLIAKAHCNRYDILILGITIVIGGQYFSWNAGLVAGFGSYFIATVLIGSAYFCLCLSVSELSSALPFAGGAYGLARCTLGFYAGFMVGCCESAEYICYVALSAVSLGSIIITIIPFLTLYQPLIWLLFYASALSVYIFGGKIFWRINIGLGIASVVIILVFCFGSLHWVNTERYATSIDGKWFIGGFTSFLRVIPISTWFFVGVESLNMACDDVVEPKKSIPWAQTRCIVLLNVTAIFVLIVCSSLPGDIISLASDLTPLNSGWCNILLDCSQLVPC